MTRFDRMVDAVKLRSGDHPGQRAEVESQVRVDEHRPEADDESRRGGKRQQAWRMGL